MQRCIRFENLFGNYSFTIGCKYLLSFAIGKEIVYLLEIKSFTMKTTTLLKNSFFCMFLISYNLFSQNTLEYNDEKGSENATLEDVKWLSGNWKGTSPFGICQENWDEPSGKTMMFCFKMINDNKVTFYEFGQLIEKDKTIQLQIRHFSTDLKPWEKEQPEVFNFIKKDGNKYYFDGITYEKIGDAILNVYVYLEESKEEIKFSFMK